jgi:ribosomal protein L12E/L44/L45/RPP1/RPP2
MLAERQAFQRERPRSLASVLSRVAEEAAACSLSPGDGKHKGRHKRRSSHKRESDEEEEEEEEDRSHAGREREGARRRES